MKTSNFKTEELQEYFNTEKIIFLNFRKVYQLIKENNSFKFIELMQYRSKGSIPITKKGRFFAIKKNDKYLSELTA
jgi:hypothetical protein